jgi:hypothetical protein
VPPCDGPGGPGGLAPGRRAAQPRSRAGLARAGTHSAQRARARCECERSAHARAASASARTRSAGRTRWEADACADRVAHRRCSRRNNRPAKAGASSRMLAHARARRACSCWLWRAWRPKRAALMKPVIRSGGVTPLYSPSTPSFATVCKRAGMGGRAQGGVGEGQAEARTRTRGSIGEEIMDGMDGRFLA